MLANVLGVASTTALLVALTVSWGGGVMILGDT